MSNPTAAVIIIGNEVLSGRTLDTNTQVIATKLVTSGIDLQEVRVIPDNHKAIVDTVLAVKDLYDYIFTTGGIGPTHDDITSEAIADAFGVPLIRNREAYQIIKDSYHKRGQELNPAREKMAYLPEGSKLIYNCVSAAPGFNLGNVYVMAGVPHIMQAMLEFILPTLKQGKPVRSMNIDIMLGESLIAVEFAGLQKKYPEVEMGSYPYETAGKHATSLVLRSNHYEQLESAYKELDMIAQAKLNNFKH